MAEVRNIEWYISWVLGNDDHFLAIGMGNPHLIEDVGILPGAVTNHYRSFVNQSDNVLDSCRVIPSIVGTATIHPNSQLQLIE